MSSGQVPPGSPIDEGRRDETVPLEERGGGGAGDERVDHPLSSPAPKAGAVVSEIAEEMRTPETKESFKTSEFMVMLLGIVGVLLASEVSAEFDASRAWMAITILAVGYLLSRGLAKAGTNREYLQPARPEYRTTTSADPEAAFATPASRPAGRHSASPLADHLSTPETKEFYKSTEFLLWGLGVIGILLAAQTNAAFDATEAWRLITYLSAGYIISRGLAKAASDRGYHDPNYGLSANLAAGRVTPAKAREADEFTRRHISTPETKEFFKTSEFLVLVLAALGIMIGSSVDPIFNAPSAWTYLTITGAAYMVSRGLAKLGKGNPHLYDS